MFVLHDTYLKNVCHILLFLTGAKRPPNLRLLKPMVKVPQGP